MATEDHKRQILLNRSKATHDLVEAAKKLRKLPINYEHPGYLLQALDEAVLAARRAHKATIRQWDEEYGKQL